MAAGVAPPAGAWIEIRPVSWLGANQVVAPPAGAWIEIQALKLSLKLKKSRLPQARGLKSNG